MSKRNHILEVGAILAVMVLAADDVLSQSSPQVRWFRGTYRDSLEEARVRNVPVMIVVIQDGEEANERLVDGVIRTKEFAALADKTVPVVLSRAHHGTVPVEVDGNEYQGCKRFGYVPCDTHIAQEAKAILEIFKGEPVKTPQVMVMTPDEKVEERVIDVAGQGEYTGAVTRVLKKMGPGFDRKAYDAAKKALAQAKTALANQAYGEAFAAVKDLVTSTSKSSLVASATRVRESCEQHIVRRCEEIEKAMAAGEWISAVERLETLREEFKNTDLDKPLAKLEKELRSKKEGRAAWNDHEKQKRFLPHWERALGFEQKADWIKAWQSYDKLVDLAGKLPIGVRARQRIDQMRKDPDIRKLIDAEMASQAADIFERANRLRSEGKATDADALIEQIISSYPETPTAKKILEQRKSP